MKKLTVRFWGLAFFVAGVAQTLAGNVLINEIMYHPASGNLGESYVELFNPGPGTANLSGWRFTKGFDYVFPTNTVIAPPLISSWRRTRRLLPQDIRASRILSRAG